MLVITAAGVSMDSALPTDPFTRLQAELDVGFVMVFAIGIPTIEIGAQCTEVSEVVDGVRRELERDYTSFSDEDARRMTFGSRCFPSGNGAARL